MNKAESVLSFYPNRQVKTFGALRLQIAPFKEVISHIAGYKKVLDLGCGYGFLTNLIAINDETAQVLGIDLEKNRIQKARQTLDDRQNIDFIQGNAINCPLPLGSFDTIVCFDLLHHLTYPEQEELIRHAFSLLIPKGEMLIKEINTYPFYKYLFNYLHDKIMTKGDSLYFRSEKHWVQLLKKTGFVVETIEFPKKGSLFYPHVLITARKT